MLFYTRITQRRLVSNYFRLGSIAQKLNRFKSTIYLKVFPSRGMHQPDLNRGLYGFTLQQSSFDKRFSGDEIPLFLINGRWSLNDKSTFIRT